MINEKLLSFLCTTTDEETRLMNGGGTVEKAIYTEKPGFVVDSEKLLEKGKLIELRRHTRFAHFPKHKHNYIEMIYMCSGSTVHIVNNDRIVLSEGEILILSQNSVQEILPCGENDIAINFIILPQFFTSDAFFEGSNSVVGDFLINCMTDSNQFSEYLHYKVSDLTPVQNLMENLIWNKFNPSPFSRHITENTMSLLILHLMNYTNKIGSTREAYEKELLLKALRYIETSYAEASLTKLCSELNQSISAMSRLIKQYTGSTYNELLRTKRLSQAAYLLVHTSYDISAISETVGYGNRTFFYKAFAEKFGMTPKEYRSKNTAVK
ncbi:MAG: helix-turn-helix domain-containing protein [Clostridia bacterium]|nr:helix-turn-helix domain-containing protein [Clostridia bacterium]